MSSGFSIRNLLIGVFFISVFFFVVVVVFYGDSGTLSRKYLRENSCVKIVAWSVCK